MKALSISTLFTMLVAAYFTLNAAHETPETLNTSYNTSKNNVLVKGINRNGNTMPMVDLPLVEIVAMKNRPSILSARFIDGEIMASANLPTVEIVGYKSKYNMTIPNEHAIYDIPVIEISAEFPKKNLYAAIRAENGVIVNIDLPLVEVTTPSKNNNKLFAHLFSAIGIFDLETAPATMAYTTEPRKGRAATPFIMVFGLINWYFFG